MLTIKFCFAYYQMYFYLLSNMFLLAIKHILYYCCMSGKYSFLLYRLV